MILKKIEKLNINLIGSLDKYNEAKANYINDFPKRYVLGGFFVSGYEVPQPEVALAKWNAMFPNGFDDWKIQSSTLNGWGQQRLINKINELIDIINTKS